MSNDVRLPVALLYAFKKAGGNEEDAHALIRELHKIGDDESVAGGLRKVVLVPNIVDVPALGEEPRGNTQSQPSKAAVLEALTKELPPYGGGQYHGEQ